MPSLPLIKYIICLPNYYNNTLFKKTQISAPDSGFFSLLDKKTAARALCCLYLKQQKSKGLEHQTLLL